MGILGGSDFERIEKEIVSKWVMAQTLASMTTEIAIRWVYNQEHNVGVVMSDVFEINNEELRKCQTLEDVVTNEEVLRITLENEDVTDSLIFMLDKIPEYIGDSGNRDRLLEILLSSNIKQKWLNPTLIGQFTEKLFIRSINDKETQNKIFDSAIWLSGVCLSDTLNAALSPLIFSKQDIGGQIQAILAKDPTIFRYSAFSGGPNYSVSGTITTPTILIPWSVTGAGLVSEIKISSKYAAEQIWNEAISIRDSIYISPATYSVKTPNRTGAFATVYRYDVIL